MKKYLMHKKFKNYDGVNLEDWVNSKEFDNCELVTINTYIDYDMDVVRELWYWIFD